MTHVYIIAEAGSCHDGDPDKASRLVHAARDAGADAIKFQWTSDAVRLCHRRGIKSTAEMGKYLDAYRLLEFPVDWHRTLALEASLTGLDYLCTVYLPQDIAVVAPHVTAFKAASFGGGDLAFLDAHTPYGKPIIVSTGMMDARDVGVILATTARLDTVLHCVSAYPCPPEQANLRGIETLRGWLESRPTRVKVGYSDHTRNVLTGALAVAAGAEVLEIHVRLLETNPANLDCAAALTPGQVAEYIDLVRQAELLLGDGRKGPQDAERPMMVYREYAH